MTEPFSYVGSELELFSEAKNWKNYVFRHVARYLGHEVLEVGAGCGGSTIQFAKHDAQRWLCLEPDAELANQLSARIDSGELPSYCELKIGTLDDLSSEAQFDTLMYLDVMEHIEDDAAEFSRATEFLKPNGHLVILCPAHQRLFTPFDKAIGHFRRYDRSMMRKLTNSDVRLVRLAYLDSVGFFASLANRLILKQSMPTKNQIRTWDRMMVPLSRLADRMLFHRFGKSVLGVWQRR